MVNMMADKKQASKTSPFWKRVDELLSRSTRQKKTGVNLSRLDGLTQANQSVVVCSKVLGTGALTHALTVAAPKFSATAAASISKTGGKVVELDKLRASNPTGKDLIILI
ncbi:50S ribosomal protein L18e [uncultured archaeon]|nr:50S ribosomal protein L18e [uncultured archaeon]